VFSRVSYFPIRFAAPDVSRRDGHADQHGGEIEAENLTLACRNAVLNMMELLQERGFSQQQAYVICSVAWNLRVSNVVDVPNYVVSALLPEAIFARHERENLSAARERSRRAASRVRVIGSARSVTCSPVAVAPCGPITVTLDARVLTSPAKRRGVRACATFTS